MWNITACNDKCTYIQCLSSDDTEDNARNDNTVSVINIRKIREIFIRITVLVLTIIYPRLVI